jgi:hypothetical protein
VPEFIPATRAAKQNHRLTVGHLGTIVLLSLFRICCALCCCLSGRRRGFESRRSRQFPSAARSGSLQIGGVQCLRLGAVPCDELVDGVLLICTNSPTYSGRLPKKNQNCISSKAHRKLWTNYGPVIVSDRSEAALGSHPCRVVSISYEQLRSCHGRVSAPQSIDGRSGAPTAYGRIVVPRLPFGRHPGSASRKIEWEGFPRRPRIV